MPDVIRILTVSSLYPNNMQPRHGVFVKQRLKHLIKYKAVVSKVVAPVPWFPISAKVFGQYGLYAKVLKKESIDGVDVVHPRFVVVPKFGMSLAPFLMSIALYMSLKKIIKNGYQFDIIDAHYFYPDGVAAVIVGKLLKKPVVITARGSDINLLPLFKVPNLLIKWAASESSAMITVSKALKQCLVKMGVVEQKINVLRNGVDRALFHQIERKEAEKKVEISGKMLLSVGNLVAEKGHELAIRALQDLPNVSLVIIGQGPNESSLKSLTESLGLISRVVFVKNIPQAELKYYYNAADMLLLMSQREGMPNVLLESLACGNPVVAANVGGVPEIMSHHEFGIVLQHRESANLVAAINEMYARTIDRLTISKLAEQFSWDATTEGQFLLFQKILNVENYACAK